MSDEDALHRIITKFMLNTCRSTINENLISQRKLVGDFINILAKCLLGDGEAFTSGSFAELYVRPILYCYGDIDIMHNFKNAFVIPYGQLPPVELRDCHQDTVTVYEIIDSHKPGYVYLQPSYIARKNANGSYAVQCLRNNCMLHRCCVTVQIFFNKYLKKVTCSDFLTKKSAITSLSKA